MWAVSENKVDLKEGGFGARRHWGWRGRCVPWKSEGLGGVLEGDAVGRVLTVFVEGIADLVKVVALKSWGSRVRVQV
jgi:hypothetical protein